MVKVIKSAVDEYKHKYEIEKMLNVIYMRLIKKLEKEIASLQEENNAYRIILKKKLDDKVVE